MPIQIDEESLKRIIDVGDEMAVIIAELGGDTSLDRWTRATIDYREIIYEWLHGERGG